MSKKVKGTYECKMNVLKSELELFLQIVKEFNKLNSRKVSYLKPKKDVDEKLSITHGSYELWVKDDIDMESFLDIFRERKCIFLKTFCFALRINVRGLDKFAEAIIEYGKPGVFVTDMSRCQHGGFSLDDSYGLYMTESVDKDEKFGEIFRKYNLSQYAVNSPSRTSGFITMPHLWNGDKL